MAFPMLALAAISFGAKAYEGYSKNKSLRDEGAAVAEQGKIIYAEALRDADLVRQEGEIFAQKQSLQYIGSGVILGGSALITLKQTELYANEKANSIEARGLATKNLADQKNNIAKREGTASLISGFLGGATSALNAGTSEKAV